MSNIVISKYKLSKLCVAAANIQALLNSGALGNAFGKVDSSSERDTEISVAAFDALQEAVSAINDEIRITSPFLRYRTEFFGHYETAGRLRALVMNLWGGRPANLSALFHHADEHHTRIALECIVHFTQYGENDTFFMSLAAEIDELPAVREVVA